MPDAVVALVPAPDELAVEHLAAEPGRLIVVAAARRAEAVCPTCGCASGRVQSRYERRLADLPWHGLAVALRVRVRRFVCAVPRCPRRIFCERLPGTAAAHARRTTRLAGALELIGLALGGEAGARLARELGMAAGASADTLLRVLQAGPRPRAEPPVRVLGVDDWAWRKGRTYGTVLVDLERRRVLDLLPDREAATLAAWLRARPGVEIISRDRGGAYAEGAALGAPDAVQVADRFHLLRNLTGAVGEALERHRRAVHAAVPPLERPAPTPYKRGGPVARRDPQPRAAERAKAATRARRLALYEQVMALRAAGLSQLAIERRTGVSRHTIIRWSAAGHFPERRDRAPRPTQVTPHAAYLRARWDAGCHNATRLWRELREHRGFRGGHSAVRDWITAHLRGGERRRMPAAALPRTAHPAPRRAAWLWCKAAAALTAPERAYVDAVCAASPPLAEVRRLAASFRAMLAGRDPNALAPWLAAAERSELRPLATSLRRDRDAVLAAVCFRWSNGQVEGQVNRLKLVKRSMYGRAGFALLRRRVLAA